MQWLAEGRCAGDRSLQRLHGDLRSLFRPVAGLAFYRSDAGQYLAGEDCADRLLRRPEPPGQRSDADLCRVRAPGPRDRRALHGSIHLRRTRHRLARQQQYRRVDFPAVAQRALSRADLAGFQPWYRRHPGHAGALCALPPALHTCVLCRCRTLGVLRLLPQWRCQPDPGLRFAHRRYRSAAGRSVLFACGDRCHVQGAGCAVPGRHALLGATTRPPGRWLQWHQPGRGAAGGAAHGRSGRNRLRGGDSLRWWRTLCHHLLRCDLAAGPGL
ncbi:hypothetical protein D9M68_752770 [compost metagenome]